MNIIPDGNILCIECGKPIFDRNVDFYYLAGKTPNF